MGLKPLQLGSSLKVCPIAGCPYFPVSELVVVGAGGAISAGLDMSSSWDDTVEQ